MSSIQITDITVNPLANDPDKKCSDLFCPARSSCVRYDPEAFGNPRDADGLCFSILRKSGPLAAQGVSHG